jgi:hypothetical protein
MRITSGSGGSLATWAPRPSVLVLRRPFSVGKKQIVGIDTGEAGVWLFST